MSTPEESSNVVNVPKPPLTAYDPSRPLSKNPLLTAQVTHMRHVEMTLPPEQQTGIPINSIQTEGQAAFYLRKVTQVLHPEGARREKVRKA